tara:strand:+ start:161 stop:424 length:264 start_codon:yes stop_codon:yes gene_type:complete
LNPIAVIIETLLDEHRDAGTHSNPELAGAIANALTVASWQQLASVTGGTVEQDQDGQVVLYTGCFTPQPAAKIIHARELTLQELADV